MKRLKELEKYLPEGWQEKARESNALCRARNIRNAEDLLMVNLVYLMRTGSYGKTAGWLNLTSDIHMDKNAVYRRICQSGEWLRWMAEAMAREDGFVIDEPSWLKGRSVVLIDGSELSVKGSKKGDYWLHYALDLFHFQCRDVKIAPITQGETLTIHDFGKNDIVIADRGYCSIKSMECARKNEADFVLRYRKNGFTLYDEQGTKIDILALCRGLEPTCSKSILVYYKDGKTLRPVRIVIWRKDAESEAKSERKLKQKRSHKHLNPEDPETIELNHYLILETSLFNESKEQVLELYRARWQVEEVFYRLKGLFDFGDIPSKKPDSVHSWLYGKLFLAFLLERILKRESFPPSEEERIWDAFEGLRSMDDTVYPVGLSYVSHPAGDPRGPTPGPPDQPDGHRTSS